MLSQGGFDNWIEIVILLLIFGGSALGSVAKALIKHFRGDTEVEGKPPTPQTRRQPTAPKPPMARPMPSIPRPGSKPQTPYGQIQRPGGESAPRPSGQIPARRRSMPQPPRRQPEPASFPPVVAVPEITLEEVIKQATTVVKVPSKKKQRRPKPEKRESPAKRKPSTGQAPAPLEQAVHDTEIDDVIGRNESDADRPTRLALRVGPATRATLRRAIVLNEVLGKPIALRDEDTARWDSVA